MEPQITDIEYLNTASGDMTSHFTSKSGCTFERVWENGDGAQVAWIAVSRNGKLVAKIKEGVCNIYY
jgi:hypothetical protein